MTREEQEDALDATTRAWTGVLPMVVVAAGLAALPLLPAVRTTLRVEVWQMAVGIGCCLAPLLLATIVYHLAGPRSFLYRVIDHAETIFIEVAILGLVFAGGRGDSFFWLLYLAHLATAAGMSKRAHEHLAVFGGLPVLLSLAFLIFRHDVSAAVLSVASGALGLVVLWLVTETHRKLDLVLEERGRLASQLAEVKVRDERLRIARDLHDGLGADLAAVAWRAQVIRHESADVATKDDLGGIIERASQGVDELRSVVWALRAPERRWIDVVDYLRVRCEELCAGRVTFTLRDTGEPLAPLSGEVSMHLVRMIQESVRNAVRHSGARSISVDLEQGSAAGIRAAISDDGVGIDATVLARSQGGLANLRERAAAVGGGVSFEATAPGSRVVLSLPLVRAPAPAQTP